MWPHLSATRAAASTIHSITAGPIPITTAAGASSTRRFLSNTSITALRNWSTRPAWASANFSEGSSGITGVRKRMDGEAWRRRELHSERRRRCHVLIQCLRRNIRGTSLIGIAATPSFTRALLWDLGNLYRCAWQRGQRLLQGA